MYRNKKCKSFSQHFSSHQVFRTKAISEITNAHLADDSSSSYLGIVRLSFSVFALRDRRKKLALRTHFSSQTHTIDSESQSICDFLRSPLSSTSSRQHRIIMEFPTETFRSRLNGLDGRRSPARLRLTPFFPWYAYLSTLRVRSWRTTID